MDSLPQETVAHIQSVGCNLQKKSVIGAHNRCLKYLIGAISTHGEANRSLEILGGDKDRQLHTLWKETKVVISGAFIIFLLHNHSVIYKIIIFFFRRSKRQRNFSLFIFASEES